MPFRLAFLALVFGLIGLDPAAASDPGATSIDESLVVATLHVSPSGDDTTGNGSASTPFRSITKGLHVAHNHYNAAHLGVRVLVHPGTYREGAPGGKWAIVLSSPATPAPVILEGAGWNPAAPANTGDVILSGSEIWSGGWTSAGNGTWTRPWPYTWGASPLNGSNPPAAEPFRRYELVHVDGQTYYQVAGPTDTAALAKLTAAEGAFWVNESTGLITVRPPATVTDLNTRLVEVTTKRKLLYHYRPGTAASATNLIVRNLVFQHAAPGLMESAVHFQNNRNILVEDCVVRNNKHTGLNMDMRAPYTVRRLSAVHNGEAGAGGRGRSALWEDSDFSHNARQAHISGYYSWTVCGIKLGDAQDTVVRRSRASSNAGFGFWWDTACFRSELSDSAATHNFASGVFIEFNNNANNVTPALGSDTSVLVRNTVLAHNRRPPVGTYMGRGAVLSENENAVFDHVVFHDNDNQLGILENSRGPQGRTVIRHSVLSATTPSQLLYANAYGTTMWRQFFDTLDASTNDNRYVHPDSVAFPNRDQVVNQTLSGWRSQHLNNANNLSADRAVDSRSVFASSGYSGQPLVSIQTFDTYVAESNGAGSFTVSRASADLSAPLTVEFTVPTGTGLATPGADYAALGTSVTIPAGRHHVTVAILPVADDLAEGDEIVRLQLATSAAYVLGRASAEFILVDAQTPSLPDVSVVSTSPLAREQDEVPGVFTVSRTGNLAEPLLVRYALSGTATAGADYLALAGTFTLPAGAASAPLAIVPIDDTVPELDETIVITLLADDAYRVGQPGHPATATLTLRDNDAIPADPVHVQVGADGTATYSLTLHNPASSAQTFTLTLPAFADYTITTSNDPGGPVYDWQDISATGTRVTNLDNSDDNWTVYTNGQRSGATGPLPFGFSFPFYPDAGGGHFSAGFINSNGILALANPGSPLLSSQSYNNQPLPNTSTLGHSSLPPNSICFFWDDLRFTDANGQPAGAAYIRSIDQSGDGTPDTFVVQFTDVRHFSDRNRSLTAQSILRADGEIILQYKEVTFDQARFGATIGIQDGTPGTPRATQVAYNSNYVTAELAVRLTPPVRWLTAASTSLTVPAGSSTTLTLTFDASGFPVGATRSAPILLTSNLGTQPAVSISTQMTVIEPPELPPPPIETTVSFTEGAAGYTHVGATLRSGQATSNFGTNAQIIVGLVNGNDRMRGALSFPLTAIPADSLITAVSLDLTTASQGGQDTLGGLELHALTGTPAESSVTWQTRSGTTAWTTPGGDFLSPALASLPAFDATLTGVTRNFATSPLFVDAVQGALDAARPLDLLVRSASAEAQTANRFVRFASDDDATLAFRPRLHVTYRPLSSLTPFQRWLHENGHPFDTAATAGEPPLLLAYALGLTPSPSEPNPNVRITNIAPRLEITFLRARAELTYEVLASSDLVAWTVIATNPGEVGQDVTVTDPVSINPRRFLRLRVTQ